MALITVQQHDIDEFTSVFGEEMTEAISDEVSEMRQEASARHALTELLIPYWIVVIPLTILSAVLILRPGKRQTKLTGSGSV